MTPEQTEIFELLLPLARRDKKKDAIARKVFEKICYEDNQVELMEDSEQ